VVLGGMNDMPPVGRIKAEWLLSHLQDGKGRRGVVQRWLEIEARQAT
jgi:hypothetical protein